MTRIHVEPGQTVMDAIRAHDVKERTHQQSSMTFELGLDHVMLNGHRILRPTGVSRTSWEKFWATIEWQLIDLH